MFHALFMQNALSHHNLSYWKGRQYIGIGPGNIKPLQNHVMRKS